MGCNSTGNTAQLGAFKELLVANILPVAQVKFPYHISSRELDTASTGSGTVTQSDSLAVISTGAANSSSASLFTHDTIVYQPGQGALARFTAAFTQGVAGSQQEIGVGDDTDGFFIGYNGADFGVLRRQNGTDYWTSLPHVGDGSSEFLGRVDLTKGNVFQIQYQWLGFGQIRYSIFNTDLDRYEVLHIEKYPNTNTVPSIYNPSLPLRVHTENTTNDTDVVIRTASLGAYVEGKGSKVTSLNAISNSKTVTTEVNVLTIRVRSTYHSKTNRGVIFPFIVSAAAEGTKPVTINIYQDATLGGTPSYTDIDTNESLVEYDTAGTTVSGGYLVGSFVLGKSGSGTVNLDRKIRSHKSDTLTITAQSDNSSDVVVAINWEELI